MPTDVCLFSNSPDPIVPILGTSSAKVTEWVSRQSLKRMYFICWVMGTSGYQRFLSIYPCVIPVESYTRGWVQGGRFPNGLLIH